MVGFEGRILGPYAWWEESYYHSLCGCVVDEGWLELEKVDSFDVHKREEIELGRKLGKEEGKSEGKVEGKAEEKIQATINLWNAGYQDSKCFTYKHCHTIKWNNR